MKSISLLLLLLCMSGCASLNVDSFATVEIHSDLKARDKNSQNQGVINFHGIPLQQGQIIVSNKNTALNLIVSLTDTQHHPYAHAGIIAIEKGKPFVYHSFAQVDPSFKRSATEITKGVVTRTSLNEFLSNKMVTAIYEPASTAIGKSMVQFAQQAHAEKLPYDAQFDEVDRSKVYCSEFVVSAIESATGTSKERITIPLRARSQHPSINTIYEWLEIKAQSHYFISDLVTKNRRVALLSEKLTAKQIKLYTGLRAELHRRFTPDQKIGNIMSWVGTGVKFRPQIKEFIQRGIDGDFRELLVNETQSEWITALANEVLGPAAILK